MSTRYVWDRYDYDYVRYLTTSQPHSTVGFWYDGIMMTGPVSTVYFAIYSDVTNAVAGRDNTTGISLRGRGTVRSFDISNYGESNPRSIRIPANSALVFAETQSALKSSMTDVWGAYVTRASSATLTIYYDVSSCEIGSYTGIERFHFASKAVLESTSRGLVSSSSQSSYPNGGIRGDYWYTYQGSDNIDPTAVGYNKTTPKGGESITINVSPRSNTYGGTITYKYEVQLSGGAWTNIGSTTSTAKSYVIPKGTTTFRARVVASDNMGFTSTDYVTGNTCSVINNTAPSISGEDSDLGTFRYEYPTISYIITDPDEQNVTRKIELDSTVVVSEESITLDQEYTYTVTEEQMAALADGVHTIKITATDSEGASAVRQYTFTKFFGSDTLYQRLRRLNDLGLYDTIYFENMASNIIRPNGMTVQETIDRIEADLAELEK